MTRIISLTAFTVVTALASTAHAQVWPQTFGAMNHALIDLNGSNEIELHLETPAPLEMMNFGESHNSPADVLDGKYYNDQYGWLANGAFAPPVGGGIWIRLVDATPGLEFYSGGMRPMKANHSYAPLFGTDGTPDIWQWGGTMTHHWVTAPTLGDYEATFEVYVGDVSTGAPLTGYTGDQLTLAWTAVPEPSAAALLCIGLPVVLRRRR